MMLDGAARGLGGDSELSRIRRFNKIPKTDVAASSEAIFVYRDPFDRIASLYINKLVQRHNGEDLAQNYRELTGQNPQQASFESFITIYAGLENRRLDPHLKPQRRHLLPILYEHAIPIHDLERRMGTLIGREKAAKYFGRAVNATRNASSYSEELIETQAADDLHTHYHESGILPAKSALLTPALKERIAKIYAEDLIFADP
jgi:hypothetical protein